MADNLQNFTPSEDDEARFRIAADYFSGKGPVPGACLLCGKPGPVRLSHVVPAFVIDWLKETSATGYLREGYRPNLRQQDGPKAYMMCHGCEQVFGDWENETARRLFRPLHKDPTREVHYDASFLRFCVSVSWRVLTAYRAIGLSAMNDDQRRNAEHALQVWSEFLLGERPNPGLHEQHVVLLAELADANGLEVPPNFNRYSLRGIEIDVAGSARDTFVYSKMCGLLLVGFVTMGSQSRWKGTKVRVRGGRLGPTHYELPAEFLDYFLDKARAARGKEASISPKQRARISEDWRRNLGRAATSETMRVQSFDVALFGKDASAWGSRDRDEASDSDETPGSRRGK